MSVPIFLILSVPTLKIILFFFVVFSMCILEVPRMIKEIFTSFYLVWRLEIIDGTYFDIMVLF